MTSNIGSQYITEELDREERRRRVMDALRAHFRPEFLNRVDETIIFDRLDRDTLKEIVAIQVERVRARAGKMGITLEFTESALERLANEGFDSAYGARPLKRAIQRLVLDKLSLEMLEGQIQEGDTVTVAAAEGEDRLRFSKTSAGNGNGDMAA